MHRKLRKQPSIAWAAFLFVTLTLAPLVGCSTGKQIAEVDDSVITADIDAQIAANSSLSPHPIKVKTSNGAVQLTGTVAKSSQRTAVEKLAAATPGVRSVSNNVRFGTPAPVTN